MREIKFRAWDGYKMINRCQLFSMTLGGQICVDRGSTGIYCVNYPLMQYTGLKDKNGVEIYEGDIVRRWSYGYNCGGMGDKQVLSVVEWDEANACFESCIDRRNGVEVVGNIYENKELLGG